jgi:hypothetical protein
VPACGVVCPRSQAAPKRWSSIALEATISITLEGIGFAPETIAKVVVPRILFMPDEGNHMTAYLISLSLAGLIAIVLWEGLS